MKNINLSEHSLMKVAPLDDVFQEPQQTYVKKEGWFGIENNEEKKSGKPRRLLRKKGKA